MRQKAKTGVVVDFKDKSNLERVFDTVTNIDWENGFAHLSVKIVPEVYDEKGELVKMAKFDTVASFNQDVIFSITDLKERKVKNG